MTTLWDGFVGAFLTSFLTNIWVAAASLALGLIVGAPLAWLRHRSRWLGRLAALLTSLLRAAPTFVVMYFLLNIMPNDFDILGLVLPLPNVMLLVLALAIYAAAYVSDNLLDALRHHERGATAAALLFIPNMMRAFFVLVMASSVGAAIGVHEAVTTTLRETDRLSTIGSRIGLVIAVILFFASIMQLARLGASRLTRALSRRGSAPAIQVNSTAEASLVAHDT
jgi:His/Glu/Gln/Arg/opine family amino acid ABC transporter permease subunit